MTIRWPEGTRGKRTTKMSPALHSLLKNSEAADLTSLLTAWFLALVETTDPHEQLVKVRQLSDLPHVALAKDAAILPPQGRCERRY